MKAKDAALTAVLVVACSALSAFAGAAITKQGDHAEETTTEVRTTGSSSRAYMASTPPNFVEVAEKTIDGVVNIRTEKTVRMSRRGGRFIDPFEFFFGIPSQPEQPQQREAPKQVGIGSGVIISAEGYIVTNNHVVEGADDVFVTTNGNEEYTAKVVGTDPATDLALLKIDAGEAELTVIPFGNSDDLRVGEWVLAIGNPFNLRSTVTAGIVSAKGRAAGSGQGSLQVGSFIQSDVAVNPGNSGGALVNMSGELIGINTMIYSSTGSYAGVSFAIPTSIVHKVVSDLKEYGTVQRAMLGIVGTNINSEATEEYDLKVSQGALVVQVADRSAAKQAGIKEQDVITAVDGHPIATMSQLQEMISTRRPGDKVKVTVNRHGEEKKLDVQLRNSEGNTDVVKRIDESSIGAAFVELTEQEQSKLGISYGVKVAGVDRDGKFFRAGIRKGDVILAINNIRISEKGDVDKIVSDVIKSDSDKVLFVKLINNNGRVKYTAVDLRE